MLKFKSVKKLQALIDEYFADCEKNKKNITITGLALWLDTTRETLMDYQKNDKFAGIIKRAKLRIENAYENRLIARGNSGDIFVLKQFGWNDKREAPVLSGDEIKEAYLEAMAGLNVNQVGKEPI